MDAINTEFHRLVRRACGPNKTTAYGIARDYFFANFRDMDATARIVARDWDMWKPDGAASRATNRLAHAHVVACDEGLFINGRHVAR